MKLNVDLQDPTEERKASRKQQEELKQRMGVKVKAKVGGCTGNRRLESSGDCKDCRDFHGHCARR